MRLVLVGALVLASCSSCSGTQRAPAAEITSAIRWKPPVDLAQGGGTRGEWRQNDSDYDHVDDGTVALAEDGSSVVAWVDHRSKEIFVQRLARDGSAHRSPVAVARTPGVFSWLPRLALAGSDVYVVWQEIVFSGGTHGGELYFARSRDGGATFDAPRNLSRSRAGDGKGRINAEVWHNGSLDLAVGSDGMIYAAWTAFDGRLWLARSTDRGATFAAPQLLGDGTPPARAPAIAVGRDAVYLAWTIGDTVHANLRLAISRDKGAQFAPAVITHTKHYSDAPKLAVDPTGTLHLVWAESRGGPLAPAAIRYMRSRNGGRSFETPRVLSTGDAAFPMLALGGGNVVVSWERLTGAHQRSRGLMLVYSTDAGTTFSRPELVPGSIDAGGGFNGSHQGRLMEKLAVHDGEIAIANSALALGRSSHVWLVRGRLPAFVARR